MNYNGLEMSTEDKNNIDFATGLLKMNDILCTKLGQRVLDKVICKLVNSLDKNNCIENYRETILPINYASMRLSHLNLIRECENIKL
ncbi:hypothetical protein [Clostridium beijerinckii]|uniref:hypothetical protein n=1 Tax=Clostridium beijerinckii TaxID=1520 RepID=UPI00156E025E|nr:hypothetical protein [Clostridium beijerinckii]NRU52650.1 hypothetical protein [Clostridium beijerinckii]NYC68693.1 hypothetical protein [Clostridium beijerinckii]NYC91842.1 hypothetical protein [Clostridium beijerinckii]